MRGVKKATMEKIKIGSQVMLAFSADHDEFTGCITKLLIH